MDFNADHFALFNLPRIFRLDAAQLDARFRDLQAQVHPDRFADANESQQRLSLQWATKVNEAYQALKKPLSRAIYLLELAGDGIDLANNRAMSAEFLVEQMEWREAVAEVIQSDLDTTRAERELRAIVAGGEKRGRMLADFAELRTVIGGPGASDRFAARMVTELHATEAQ